MRSGEVRLAYAVQIDRANGFTRASVRINDDPKKARIIIDSVDHVEGTDENGVYHYVRSLHWRASTIWTERVFRSEHIAIFYAIVGSPGTGRWNYYQYTKDDGPMKKLTQRNIAADVGSDPVASEFVRKSRVARVIQGVMYGVGSVVMITGFVRDMRSDDNNANSEAAWDYNTRYFIAGGVLLIAPQFLRNSRQQNLLNALRAYK